MAFFISGGRNLASVRRVRTRTPRIASLIVLPMSASTLLPPNCSGPLCRPKCGARCSWSGDSSGSAVRGTGVGVEWMVGLVQREGASSLVVVVGDDLQWADEASLGGWRRLAEVAGQAPLLLVGVSRPVPRRVVVDRVREAVARVRDAVVVEL